MNSAATIAGWAVLAIDALWLALPQRDVRQFEVASNLQERAAGAAAEVGRFIAGSGESWPVYNLDESLRLQRRAPAARRICVFFEAPGETSGLLCDRVWSLPQDTDLHVEPVPGCFTGLPSPTTGLAQFRKRMAVVTNRGAICLYLALLRQQAYVE